MSDKNALTLKIQFASDNGQSYLIRVFRLSLHKMNWEESDKYDFDFEFNNAATEENPPHRESVCEFL